MAKWTAEELVSFVAKVLYEVVQNELTLDYAFQKVKRRWRALESFKVFYDASFDAVRHYYFLRFAASKLPIPTRIVVEPKGDGKTAS